MPTRLILRFLLGVIAIALLVLAFVLAQNAALARLTEQSMAAAESRVQALDSVLEPTKQAVLEMKATLDAAGIEIADQVTDRDRPLIFVAMVAALHDHGRTRTVLDHGDRHARRAPGIVMRRMRDHQEAGLLALAIEIDSEEGTGRARGRLGARGAD